MSEHIDPGMEKRQDLEDTIVKVVDWLAFIENPDHSDGESLRFGYYDAPQDGPIRHGGIYVGVHRTYSGEEDGQYHDWHQLALLYPAKYSYADDEYLMSIVIDNNNLHVGDQGDTEFARESAEQFMEWLASAQLELTPRDDARRF